MSATNSHSFQQNLMPMWSQPLATGTELPANFQANGFWQVAGQTKAGTLRRDHDGAYFACFIVSHKAGPLPFEEPTKVTFQSRNGPKVTGHVMKPSLSKDAGGQAACSEYDSGGERCQKTRFWQTYCKEHTRAMRLEITDDGRICGGSKQDGTPCRNRAKVGGYCAQHGNGSAPREKTTRLYKFPMSNVKITREQN